MSIQYQFSPQKLLSKEGRKKRSRGITIMSNQLLYDRCIPVRKITVSILLFYHCALRTPGERLSYILFLKEKTNCRLTLAIFFGHKKTEWLWEGHVTITFVRVLSICQWDHWFLQVLNTIAMNWWKHSKLDFESHCSSTKHAPELIRITQKNCKHTPGWRRQIFFVGRHAPFQFESCL